MKRRASSTLDTPTKKKKHHDSSEDNYFASLGQVHFRFGKYEEAISAVSRAIELNQNNAGYYCSLGAILSKLQKYEEAIAPYNEAVRLEPTNPEYWGNLGYAHFKLRQYTEAIAPYNEAVRLEPTNPEYWDNLGYAHFKLEQYQEACSVYKKLTNIDPTNTKYWSDLGYVYLKLGNNKEAIFVYTKLTGLAPTNVEYLANLGVAYFKAKKYEEAIVTYTRLTELEPNNVEHWASLGYANFKSGQYHTAVTSYTKGISLDTQYILNKISATLIQSTDSIEKAKEVIINFIIPLNKSILRSTSDELVIQKAKSNIAEAIVKYAAITSYGKDTLLNEAIKIYLELGSEDSLNKIHELAESNNYSNEKKAEIYFTIGNRYFLQKAYDKALVEYKACIKLNSKHTDSYVKASSVYYVLGQNEEAALYKEQANNLLDHPLMDKLDAEIHDQELIVDLIGDIS